MKSIKTRYRILIITAAVLAAARIALPYAIKYYVNHYMAHMQGCYGRVDTVDVHIYRGAYSLRGVLLNTIDPKTRERHPFFKAAIIDLSIEWHALLHGSIRGSVTAEEPELLLSKEKVRPDDVKNVTVDYTQLAENLMPLRVNSLELNDGAIRYTDDFSTPKVDIALKNAHIVVTNLSNVVAKDDELPSTIKADADVYGGKFKLDMKLNALAKQPKFELKGYLKNTNLTYINDFFKAYGSFDVSGGMLDLYTEIAARDGEFTGYIKPLITGLRVLGPKADKNKSILHQLWLLIVTGASNIIKNHPRNRVATKIPLSGRFDNPKIGVLETIGQLLKNAFISALVPTFDEEITLNSLKTKKK